jgi:hypothetical protein
MQHTCTTLPQYSSTSLWEWPASPEHLQPRVSMPMPLPANAVYLAPYWFCAIAICLRQPMLRNGRLLHATDTSQVVRL